MRRRGPLAAASTATVVGLGVVAALRAVGTVLVAEGVARGVAQLAVHGDIRVAIAIGAIGALLRAVATWAATTVGARTGADLVARLRGELGARALGPGAEGGEVLLGAHRLDDLETYCTTVLPALVNAAVIPVVIGARILLADWVSAVVIAVTIPLVPVFMALVGLHTKDRVEHASEALERLSGQLLELARGLPVLVGLGRVGEQAELLRRISDELRVRTMATLRVVFLSSLVLELVATISVAVVAVAVGLRLLAGGLPLWAGLLALVLAPECFAALRDVGAAFHAGDAGLAAHDRARRILDAPVAAVSARSGPPALHGLSVQHEGRGMALDGFDLEPVAGGITAIVGRSGSGKSTALSALAGLVDRPGAVVVGSIMVPRDGIAYLPQQPEAAAETVDDELRLYGAGLSDRARQQLLDRVGLAGFGPDDPKQLSPGELRRLAFARVLARVELGARLVLLDEPTAHLDPANRRRIEALIAGFRGTATVVLVTHEPSTIALADAVVRLGDGPEERQEAMRIVPPDPQLAARLHPGSTGPERPMQTGVLVGLGGLLRPVAWRFALGGLLGLAAALAAASLTGVSGWLIVRASEHPSITFLLVAIVGVRFFGIARAVLRYAERLAVHDAVLRAVTTLRGRLWSGLAAHGATSRKLFSGATALDLLVVAADQVRDLVPRVLLPPVVGAAVAAAAVVAVALLQPAAVPVLVLGLLVAFVGAPAAALIADRSAGPAGVDLRGRVARTFAAAVAAADDLRGNGVTGEALERVRALDDEVRLLARRRALARGMGGGLAVLACCSTSIALLAVADATGTHAPVAGVLALLPLALLEPAQVAVDGTQRFPSLAAAWGRVQAVLRPTAPEGADSLDAPVDGFALQRLGARWEDGSPLVLDGVDASVDRGEWLVVSGPSGSGKSTLLTVLLGMLPPAAGRYRLGHADVQHLRRAAISRQVAWSPQEAHVFDSSVRANLLLGRRGATERELLGVLDRVGLGPLIRSADEGLDLRVGAGGRALSGGERARLSLARALLSDAAIVLLDEPTAHLDPATATALMDDLRDALRDRAVVLVSHRPEDVRAGDRVLKLGRAAEVVGVGVG